MTENKLICKNEEGEAEIDLTLEDTIDGQGSELTVAYALLRAIEGRGEVQVKARNGYIALATSLAALRSAAENRTVTLEEIYAEEPRVIDCIKK